MAPAMVEGVVAPAMPADREQHRHASANALFHHLTAFGGKLHRWYDKAIGVAHERPLAPFVLTAGDHVQHLQRRAHMMRFGEGGPDMFQRAGRAGIDGVQIHLEIVGDVAAHHRALQEVDIVEHIGDPRRIMQVLHCALAVIAPLHIDHMHRGPGGAVMHAGPRKAQVMGRIAAAEGDFPIGLGQHVLDQRARKAQPPVLALNGADRGENFNPAFRRVREADLFQSVQRGLMDTFDPLLGQRAVHPALHARTYRALIVRRSGGAQGAAGGATARAAGGRSCHRDRVLDAWDGRENK